MNRLELPSGNGASLIAAARVIELAAELVAGSAAGSRSRFRPGVEEEVTRAAQAVRNATAELDPAAPPTPEQLLRLARSAMSLARLAERVAEPGTGAATTGGATAAVLAQASVRIVRELLAEQLARTDGQILATQVRRKIAIGADVSDTSRLLEKLAQDVANADREHAAVSRPPGSNGSRSVPA